MKNVLIALFVLSVAVVIAPNKVQAAAALTASETVANVAQVVEVKAARTLTAATAVASSTAGTAAGTITVGTCVVTFATTTAGTAYVGALTLTADEANCTDNVATILLATTSNDTALTAAQTAQELRGLKNVSDTGHGALTVGGSASTVSFTTTGTEAAATNITFATTTGDAITTAVPTTGVIPVTAVAQVVTFTLTQQIGYAYTITLNGTEYSYNYTQGTLKESVEDLNASVNSAAAITCTENDVIITCTADSAGTAFTYSASVAVIPAVTTTSSTGGRSGGGGGSRVVATTQTQTTLTTPGVWTAAQIQSIKNQINSLLQLVQRLQQKLIRIRGY